jgi:hypothetical protein
VSDKTLYAVIRGDRPGRSDKVRAAMREIEGLAKKSFRHV